MPLARKLLLPALTLLAAPSAAQEARVRDTPPRPLAEAEDPVNRLAEAQTVDGLVLTVLIDGPAVTLQQAVAARIPRKPQPLALSEREEDFASVIAYGYAGGRQVSRAHVPDSVIRALDDWTGRGQTVRVTRREVVIPLPAPQALDSVVVIAPATRAQARLDVRRAYALWCREGGQSPYCPTGGRDQPPR